MKYPSLTINSCLWNYDNRAHLLGNVCNGLPLFGGEVVDTTELVGTVGELCSSQRLQLWDFQHCHTLTQLIDLVTRQRAGP